MDGLIVVDKPRGCTSHDAVLAVRRLLGTAKVGHCGTLDPEATGILLVAFGLAVRFFPFLSRQEKTYEGTIRLGFSTDTYDAAGRPLLSWRVHILPFIDEQKLYDEFHLDEPWDSEHNRKLIEKMPDAYRSPASKLKQKGLASYLLPIGEGTVCPGRRGVEFKEITDGTANTMLLVEVDDEQAVVWTKPEDLPYDPQQPAKGLGGLYRGGFHAVTCDAAAHLMPLPLDPEVLRRLFARADGHVIDWDQIQEKRRALVSPLF